MRLKENVKRIKDDVAIKPDVGIEGKVAGRKL